jgi:hypothetical protein
VVFLGDYGSNTAEHQMSNEDYIDMQILMALSKKKGFPL